MYNLLLTDYDKAVIYFINESIDYSEKDSYNHNYSKRKNITLLILVINLLLENENIFYNVFFNTYNELSKFEKYKINNNDNDDFIMSRFKKSSIQNIYLFVRKEIFAYSFDTSYYIDEELEIIEAFKTKLFGYYKRDIENKLDKIKNKKEKVYILYKYISENLNIFRRFKLKYFEEIFLRYEINFFKPTFNIDYEKIISKYHELFNLEDVTRLFRDLSFIHNSIDLPEDYNYNKFKLYKLTNEYKSDSKLKDVTMNITYCSLILYKAIILNNMEAFINYLLENYNQVIRPEYKMRFKFKYDKERINIFDKLLGEYAKKMTLGEVYSFKLPDSTVFNLELINNISYFVHPFEKQETFTYGCLLNSFLNTLQDRIENDVRFQEEYMNDTLSLPENKKFSNTNKSLFIKIIEQRIGHEVNFIK